MAPSRKSTGTLPTPPSPNNPQFPAVLLNDRFEIRSYTLAASRLFGLRDEHVGRTAERLSRSWERSTDEALRQAAAASRSHDAVVSDRRGRVFSLRLHPAPPSLRSDGVSLLTVLPVRPADNAVPPALAAAMVDALPTPLVLVDPALRVTAANRRFFHCFRLLPAQVLRRPIERVLSHRWTSTPPMSILERAAHGRVSLGPVEMTYLCNFFGNRIVELTAHPATHGGRDGYVLLAFDDATDRREMERSLAQKTDELLRSNADLEQFANIAAHDLQAPLTKITGFSGLLLERLKDFDEKERMYIEVIHRSSRRLKSMIEDLLNFARVSSVKAPFQRIELNAVLAEVVADLENKLEESGGRVEADPLPAIRGKRNQIYQLFLNLVSNSLKYRRRDVPPLVRITHAVRPDNNVLELTFQDNGIGFDEAEADRMFKPFQRLHPRTDVEGSGIGLALCKRVVLQHDGEIEAHSPPGQGATFIIRLPIGF